MPDGRRPITGGVGGRLAVLGCPEKVGATTAPDQTWWRVNPAVDAGAATLGIAPGTVKSHARDGLARLRQALPAEEGAGSLTR